MLKYTGDFDKLKDYGFKKEKRNVGLLLNKIRYVYDNEFLEINTYNRKIEHSQFYDVYYESLETLYDLIKDGLVIKEEK